MPITLKNNAATRLAAALGSGATSMTVTTGEGAKFPNPAAGEWFPVTLVNPAGALEIVRCTARATDVLTIVRAQEGTSAIAFSIGDRVELRLTVAGYQAGIQDGTLTRIGSISGTNTLTGTVPAPFDAYANGQMFDFIVANDNTGAVTINLNGLGAKALTKVGAVALSAGNLKAGSIVQVAYDGTQFQLISGLGGIASDTQLLGVGQTWQDVTGSRALNTIYTNTTGKPIVVCVTAVSSLAAQMQISSGITTQGNTAAVGSLLSHTLTIAAGAGYSAQVSSGTPSGMSWKELR